MFSISALDAVGIDAMGYADCINFWGMEHMFVAPNERLPIDRVAGWCPLHRDSPLRILAERTMAVMVQEERLPGLKLICMCPSCGGGGANRAQSVTQSPPDTTHSAQCVEIACVDCVLFWDCVLDRTAAEIANEEDGGEEDGEDEEEEPAPEPPKKKPKQKKKPAPKEEKKKRKKKKVKMSDEEEEEDEESEKENKKKRKKKEEEQPPPQPHTCDGTCVYATQAVCNLSSHTISPFPLNSLLHHCVSEIRDRHHPRDGGISQERNPGGARGEGKFEKGDRAVED